MEKFRAQLMGDPTFLLSLGQDARFGEVDRYPVGSKFASRQECLQAGVHKKSVAGISGSKTDGAFSICLSKGYEDDQDDGEFFVYTGTGGQSDSESYGGGGKQVCDQSFQHPDNAALRKSLETKRPVRVIRGPNKRSKYAPDAGYRYDGLYEVEKAYLAKGKSGYAVCRYELRRLKNQKPLPVPNQSFSF